MRKMKYLPASIISLILIFALLLPGCELLPEITITTPTPTIATATPTPTITVTEPIDPDWNLSQEPGEADYLPDIAAVVSQVRPSVVAGWGVAERGAEKAADGAMGSKDAAADDGRRSRTQTTRQCAKQPLSKNQESSVRTPLDSSR